MYSEFQTIIFLIISIFLGGLIPAFFLRITQMGEILDIYHYKVLEPLYHKKSKLFKPLGGCPFCFCFWFNMIFFWVYNTFGIFMFQSYIIQYILIYPFFVSFSTVLGVVIHSKYL